jgi:hypothetical protein
MSERWDVLDTERYLAWASNLSVFSSLSAVSQIVCPWLDPLLVLNCSYWDKGGLRLLFLFFNDLGLHYLY